MSRQERRLPAEAIRKPIGMWAACKDFGGEDGHKDGIGHTDEGDEGKQRHNESQGRKADDIGEALFELV